MKIFLFPLLEYEQNNTKGEDGQAKPRRHALELNSQILPQSYSCHQLTNPFSSFLASHFPSQTHSHMSPVTLGSRKYAAVPGSMLGEFKSVLLQVWTCPITPQVLVGWLWVLIFKMISEEFGQDDSCFLVRVYNVSVLIRCHPSTKLLGNNAPPNWQIISASPRKEQGSQGAAPGFIDAVTNWQEQPMQADEGPWTMLGTLTSASITLPLGRARSRRLGEQEPLHHQTAVTASLGLLQQEHFAGRGESTNNTS